MIATMKQTMEGNCFPSKEPLWKGRVFGVHRLRALRHPSAIHEVRGGTIHSSVQRFSRPRFQILEIYLYYIRTSSGQLVCKFLRRLTLLGYGGEGGIRSPGRSFGPYNGLANCPFHRPVVRNQKLKLGYEVAVRARALLFGHKCATSCATDIKPVFDNR
jgi:hypothetical protein